MNDCIWCAMEVCECTMGRCDEYLSMNCEKGRKILDKWEEKVEKQLSKIRVNFAKENGFKNE